MRTTDFRLLLRQKALDYAAERGSAVNTAFSTALLFEDMADNFCPASYKEILEKEDWRARTLKPHNKVEGVLEMQSSNSSDALLMSIFCHPRINLWKGVSDLLGFVPENPVLGYKPLVAKQGTDGDQTEIDLSFDGCFLEAKLTEKDFTEKDVNEVNRYTGFAKHFHVDLLPVRSGRFQNYQIIRNLLAAIQHGKGHRLLCDERRPDLVVKYMETVSCLRDPAHRINCRVIFWQDIQHACGSGLDHFLCLKYGM